MYALVLALNLTSQFGTHVYSGDIRFGSSFYAECELEWRERVEYAHATQTPLVIEYFPTPALQVSLRIVCKVKSYREVILPAGMIRISGTDHQILKQILHFVLVELCPLQAGGLEEQNVPDILLP